MNRADPAGRTDAARYRDLYRDSAVARAYIDHRFRHPVWAAVHEREVAVLNGWIARERPAVFVEVAPGPARVSRHLEGLRRAVGIDASRAMLDAARPHLDPATWLLVEGDAAALPLHDGAADMLVAFRFLRHFGPALRADLLRAWWRVLRPGGALAFEALNSAMGEAARRHAGIGTRTVLPEPVHDATWTRASLGEELAAAGFDLEETVPLLRRPGLYFHPLVRLTGLGGRLFRRGDARAAGEPFQWQVLARRRA